MFVKIDLRIAAMFVAFGLFTICAAVCPAQMMVGNYRVASKTDEAVVSAADFAVQEQSKKDSKITLLSIERAERQIVAGSNFRMCLKINAYSIEQFATATVYQNLQNEYSLSDWSPGVCSTGNENSTPKSDDEQKAEPEAVTTNGELQVGKTDSVILYLGMESGDYAAYCFKNKSDAGRAILAKCKNGVQCEFTGAIEYTNDCKVPQLEATLSASANIVKVTSVKTVVRNKVSTVKKSKTRAKSKKTPR